MYWNVSTSWYYVSYASLQGTDKEKAGQNPPLLSYSGSGLVVDLSQIQAGGIEPWGDGVVDFDQDSKLEQGGARLFAVGASVDLHDEGVGSRGSHGGDLVGRLAARALGFSTYQRSGSGDW